MHYSCECAACERRAEEQMCKNNANAWIALIFGTAVGILLIGVSIYGKPINGTEITLGHQIAWTIFGCFILAFAWWACPEQIWEYNRQKKDFKWIGKDF